jgi:hypothetical protein
MGVPLGLHTRIQGLLVESATILTKVFDVSSQSLQADVDIVHCLGHLRFLQDNSLFPTIKRYTYTV